jgi:SAM-dependent methyltransferase
MDLKELNNMSSRRHPWETARLKALQNILAPELFEGMNALDVGCGDGYISRSLFEHIRMKAVTAVDINLTDEMILKLATLTQGIRYQREMPAEMRHDLVLLLDVLEHVESDKGFLADIVDLYMAEKSRILITVPAFQLIYGRHDEFLGHYRRYNLKELEGLVSACGLKILSSGYLFITLLLPKLVFYKLLKLVNNPDGVGNWNRGQVFTRFIEILLNIDNSLLLAANRLGIRIPGLTGWVLCEKRG